MLITWLDSNSWLIELGGCRILVDPWFVGPLTFGGAEWFFKAERKQPRAIPAAIDLILLSQGLPDHSHLPTLAQLDRDIPVVASVGAAKICTELGYKQVTALEHNRSVEISSSLKIEALIGSPVGPNVRENGYLLTDPLGGTSIYYEPHGYHDKALQQKDPIDVVITPIIDLLLPLVGPIIKGQASALEICQWLRPKFLFPTAAGGDLAVKGLLLKFLKAKGTTETLQAQLIEHKLTTIVQELTPWQTFDLAYST